MGKPSNTNPPRPASRPFPAAILLVLLLAIHASAQTPATSISLLRPTAIAFDSTGNLYFTETSNNVIRKVDTLGNITTIAGTTTQGFSGDGALATTAQLDSPQGLALNPTSNTLYIADTHNHRIRQLNLTTGILTTIAGTGTPSFSGDTSLANNATLNLPTALAIDTRGNLYLADTANHRIRRIDATTHIITTIAGNGTQGYSGDNSLATAASIDSPTGLAVDTLGNLYLADTHNHRIRLIDVTNGIITTFAGTGTASFSGDNAASTTATLALPTGIALDPTGNLYVADTANHRIRRIDAATSTITTAAGNGTQAFAGDTLPATTASLDSPQATALSPANLLTLADTSNQRIRQRATDASILTLAGLSNSIPPRPPATAAFITLTISAPNPIVGTPITLTAQITSPGTPTGTITFLDAGTPFAASPLTPTGTASITTTALAAGPHIFTAYYSGDSNFLPSTSIPTLLTLTSVPITAPDFLLTATSATTQTTLPGLATTFTFAVQTLGSLSSPITLSATGLPTGSTASFNPAYLPPGTPTNTVTLTLTPAATLAQRSTPKPYVPITLCILILPILLRRPRSVTLTLAFAAAILVSGCAARINTATQTIRPTQTYTITVTGAATSPTGIALQHVITLTLQVQ